MEREQQVNGIVVAVCSQRQAHLQMISTTCTSEPHSSEPFYASAGPIPRHIVYGVSPKTQ